MILFTFNFCIENLVKANYINMRKQNYKKEIFLYIIIGFFAGIISGFFGAGGGLLLVPFMTKILKKGEVTARATTIMCIFFMVLASSFFYYKQNSIDWNIALKSSIGGILGGYVGSKLLVKLKSNILRVLFIIFLIYSGIKLIL